MDKISKTILSYIVNFPILQDWEKSMTKPLALVFNNRQVMAKAIKTTFSSCKLIESSASINKIKETIITANSHGVMYIVEPNSIARSKVKSILELLLDTNYFGAIDNKKVSTAVILLFEGVVSKELKNLVFEIHLGVENLNVQIPILDVVPELSKLEIIREQLQRIEVKGDSIIPAAAVLYPLCSKKDYNDFLQTAKDLDKQSKEFAEQDGLVEFFCDNFKEMVVEGEIEFKYRLPNVDEEGVRNKEEALFFDDKFVYLSYTYFRKICEYIFGSDISLMTIRTALIESDIIVADKGGFTTKMSFITATGKFERTRMIKLNDEKIEAYHRGGLINLIMEEI